MKDTVVIIDGNYVCSVFKHSRKLADLTFRDMHTGVAFSFLRELLSLAKHYDTRRFAIAWDCKPQYNLRKEVFPQYKEKRWNYVKEKTDEQKIYDAACREQMDVMRIVGLPALGFSNNYLFDGYEGDDIIASLILSNPDTEFIILSTDKDLFQLLRKNVSMCDVKKSKKYTAKQFEKDHGIRPAQWADVLSITGCTTDEVPGISGVGVATAIRWLKGKVGRKTNTYKQLSCNSTAATLKRNLELVKLPYAGMPKLHLRQDAFTLRGYEQVCDYFGFRSLTRADKITEWRDAFIR